MSALFVIGAGPGVGEAAAERFGREGWKVVVSSRSPKNLDPLVARLTGKGVEAHGLVLDAANAASVRSAMRTADRITGGLAAVLYNAAFVRRQDLFSMTDAEIESDVAVNVTGCLHAIRAAAEIFRDRGGSILVTGGGLAVRPDASYASLGAGKAALRNLVEGLAPDLATRGVKIGTVTVSTLVEPRSAEARGVADALWTLATDAAFGWEITYPDG
ncbi:MAG: SDR family oxidoreductase [Hansschlegelia sp.]